MVRHIFTALLLCLCTMAKAQQQLNLYTTTQGVLTFSFADDPKVTFPTSETLAVTSATLSVEFPFSEIEKMTLEDGVTPVEQLTASENEGGITIYDLGGRQVLQIAPRRGGTRVDFSTLPVGTYIVKDGHRSYKIMRR
ncbi:MAG: T9SS type A sorting domain-containing protein [Bacteroidaceae bacterium]|nr:T9SS type A sorting domain-containing protein [Bacteroidaceae bacterium]